MHKNEVVFVPGMEIKFCLNCGSTNIEENNETIKCLSCGMGKNKSGKR
jgi:hypothetical protein